MIINIALLVIGCFMETTAILLIATPTLFPLIVALGIDPVHFGTGPRLVDRDRPTRAGRPRNSSAIPRQIGSSMPTIAVEVAPWPAKMRRLAAM